MANNNLVDPQMDHLKSLDNFYCSLIDLIPPDNFGFDESVKNQLRDYKHVSIDRKLKDYEKNRLSVPGRQLLSRLDFQLPHTVTGIWNWLDSSNNKQQAPSTLLLKPNNNHQTKQQQKNRNSNSSNNTTSSSSAFTSSTKLPNEEEQDPATITTTTPNKKPRKNDNENGGTGNQKSNFLAQKQSAKRKSKTTKLNNDSSSSNEKRMALLAKLQTKLNDLKNQRSGQNEDSKSLKRHEKNLKRTITRLEKDGSSSNKKAKLGDGTNRDVAKSLENSKKFKKGSDSTTTTTSDNKPIITNNQGHIVFSKFDFAVSGLKKSDKKNKELENLENSNTNDDQQEFTGKKLLNRKRQFAGKDYKNLLNKLENKERKLADLKERDPEKAAQVENDQKWEKALEKTQGIKIKDDKKLLKANMKRKEKEKRKTKSEWDQREENVKTKIAKRQEKRRENLTKRSEDKKSRKIEKAKRKGRLVIP